MAWSTIEGTSTLSHQALDHLIYIIGSARGGTSVLFDALGVHDGILALPGMTHFMNQVWRYRKRVHMRLLRQIFRLPGFYDEPGVVQSLEEEKGRRLSQYIDEALDSRDLKKMWQIYPLVYGLDRRNKKNPDEIRAWADKANDFYGVSSVAGAFPEGKFIFVLRDPRGAVASLAKRMAVKEAHTFQAAIDNSKVIEAAISWRWMTQRILHFQKTHPEKCFLIKLEDFLSNPVVSLNDIFEFTIDKKLPEDILSRRLDALAYGTSHQAGVLGKGIQQEPIERWRKMLGERQLGIVEALTGKTAQKAGYLVEAAKAISPIKAVLKSIPGSKRKLLNIAKIAYLQVYETLI